MEIFYYLLLCWFGFTAHSGNNLVKQMGHPSYLVREKATKDLKVLLHDDKVKVSVYFLERVANSQAQENGKPYELEIRTRCKFLVKDALWVTSKSPKLPHPPIWYLSNEIRFPCGVVSGPYLGWSNQEEGWHLSNPKKWDKVKHLAGEDNFWAAIDISAIYYKKASKQYNESIKHYFEGNEPLIDLTDKTWRNEHVEKLATVMLVEDLRRGGMPVCEVQKLLDCMVSWTGTLRLDYKFNKPGPSLDTK